MQFNNNKPTKDLTLGLVINDEHEEILLGMKKRGFGEGKWNGFGGKVKEDENIEEAMIREMEEEAGVQIAKMDHQAHLYFEDDSLDYNIHCHVYRIDEIYGQPTESEEMRPKWYKFYEIPFGHMWLDDQYWLPLFLEKKRLVAYFHFKDHETLLEKDIKVIE